MAAYTRIEAAEPGAYYLDEDELLELGGRLAASGRLEAVAGILEMGAREFPKSYAVRESLGDVYFDLGDEERGRQSYARALEANRRSYPWEKQAYETQREAELLYNGAKNALDFAVAKQAEEQAAASHRMAVSAHRLNILVAFFFPIATLTAVFGVNLRTGLEDAAPPFLFLGVITMGLFFGGILTAFVTRKPNETR